jgi:hypothetical protein
MCTTDIRTYPIRFSAANDYRREKSALHVQVIAVDEQIGWIEEPFYPNRINDDRALKVAIVVPISNDEWEYTVSGYQRMIEAGDRRYSARRSCKDPSCHRLRQGRSTMLKGRDRDERPHMVHGNPDRSQHLSESSPDTRRFELKPSPIVVQQELVEALVWHLAGHVSASDPARLGVEVDEVLLNSLPLN